MTKLISPPNNSTVMLLSQEQRDFINHSHIYESHQDTLKPLDWLHLERIDKEDYSISQSVLFLFESDSKHCLFMLSDNSLFKNSIIKEIDTEKLSISNLKTNTTYFWKVNNSEVFTFTTENAPPRFISVDGLSNVRDLGGWNTLDGHKIRQGCIYRGCEMDIHHTITDKGINTMLHELNIHTDLDLRMEVLNKRFDSPLGNIVKFYLIPISAYKDFMLNTPEAKGMAYQLFSILSDAQNYPIYFHCWGGADRTGTLSFLLNAVLGVTYDDLILDYELTSLSIWGKRSHKDKLFVEFINELNSFNGQTINEKVESFLQSCNINNEIIANLRKNLI